MTVQEQFFRDMLPYAQKASSALNVPVSVILAQWAVESDYGRSSLAQRAGNYAGIKYVAGKSIAVGKTGEYADYGKNLDMFVQDYIRVMSLGYYEKVRQAVTIDETIKELALSPYAESGYSGGKTLSSIINAYSLTKYDNDKIVSIPVPASADKMTIAGLVIVAGILMLLGGDRD